MKRRVRIRPLANLQTGYQAVLLFLQENPSKEGLTRTDERRIIQKESRDLKKRRQKNETQNVFDGHRAFPSVGC